MADATACCRKYAQCFLNTNEMPTSSHQANTYSGQNSDILNQIYENYKRCLVEREFQTPNAGHYQPWNESNAMFTDPKFKLMESSPYYKDLLKDLEEQTVGTTEYKSSTSTANADWSAGTAPESHMSAPNLGSATNPQVVVPGDKLETLSSSIENLKTEMASKSFMSTSIESLKNEMATKTFVNDTIETLKNEIVANKSYVSSSIDALKNEMAKVSACSSAEMENSASVTSAGEEQLRKVFDELEKQIEMFKVENANLVKAKVLYDTKLVKFEDLKREYEKQLFEKNKAIEDYLAAEKKKLDSEIVKLQNNNLGRNVQFDERVVNQLKEQVANLKDEMRKKEDNFKTSQYQIQQELAKLHQECNNLRSKLYIKGDNTKEQVSRPPSAKEEPSRQNVEAAAPRNEIQKELLQAEKILSEIRQKNKAFCALHGLSGQKPCVVHPNTNSGSQFVVRAEAKDDAANRSPSRAQTEKVSKPTTENWQGTNCRLHDMTVIQRTQKLLEEIKQINDIGVLDNSSELDKLEKASTNTAEKLKILQKCLALLSTAKSLNKTQKNETKEREIPVVNQTKPRVQQQQPPQVAKQAATTPVKPASNESERNANIYTELQESYQKLLDIVSTSKKSHTNQDDQEIKPSAAKSRVKSAISANRVASSTDRIPDGNKTVLYSNGSLKVITCNGKKEKIVYPNGDILERYIDEGMQKYYHSGKKLWVTKDKSGKKYIEYANGQKEQYEADGSIVVRYSDGATLKTFPDGKVEWLLADGMRLELDVSGDKVLDFPNGQKEIHTKDHKRREYPDGTVKYLFPNGTTRTEYANGKVRVKNRNGVIIYNATQAATSTV